MQNLTKNFIQKASLPQVISSDLRQQILINALPGGTKLKQDELAAKYDASVSAVREALKILESEKLVAFLPNRGAMVTELSASDVQDIFQIRIFLECGALALSLPHLTDTDLDQAELLLTEEAACTDPRLYNDINSQFHDILYGAAGNPQLDALISVLHNNIGRYMVLYLNQLHYKEESEQEHRELLAACRAKDSSKAKKILTRHMQNACKQLRSYLADQAQL